MLRSAQPAEHGICPFIWLWKRGGIDLGLLLEDIANASLNQGMLSAVLRDVMVQPLTVCENVLGANSLFDCCLMSEGLEEVSL